MTTPCQPGDPRTLGIPPSASSDAILAAILRVSNEQRPAAVTVTPDTVEGARGMVPAAVALEYIRQRSGSTAAGDPPAFSVCWRDTVRKTGGLARVSLDFAETFGGGGGADPTDPWSALLMVLSEMRRIADMRLANYADLWSEVFTKPVGSPLSSKAQQSVAPYLGSASWELAATARREHFRAVLQTTWRAGWIPDLSGQPHHIGTWAGGTPADWPTALALDYDFWGMVIVEMITGSALASKMWLAILGRGAGDLAAYYGGSAALGSLCRDGIIWVRPLLSYAMSLLVAYPTLPIEVRRVMGLTGSELITLQGALLIAMSLLIRIPGYQDNTAVGPFEIRDLGLNSWSQPGVVPWDVVHNDRAVPIESLHGTVAPFDYTVRRWAGIYSEGPPAPEPPPAVPFPPVPSMDPETARRDSKKTGAGWILAGLGVLLVGGLAWWWWNKQGLEG